MVKTVICMVCVSGGFWQSRSHIGYLAKSGTAIAIPAVPVSAALRTQ